MPEKNQEHVILRMQNYPLFPAQTHFHSLSETERVSVPVKHSVSLNCVQVSRYTGIQVYRSTASQPDELKGVPLNRNQLMEAVTTGEEKKSVSTVKKTKILQCYNTNVPSMLGKISDTSTFPVSQQRTLFQKHFTAKETSPSAPTSTPPTSPFLEERVYIFITQSLVMLICNIGHNLSISFCMAGNKKN